MTFELDRVAIEAVGADPVRLAAALVAQLGSITGALPVHEVARALDIEEIREAHLTSLEGCLLSDPQKSYGAILVNAASSRRRQRYTIAHELGHFLNERHVPTSDDGFRCTREDMSHPARRGRHLRQEREANSFAIELLAPAKLIQSHLSRAADLEHVIAISETQDISKEAAVRRYVALHDDCLAAAFSANGRIRYIEKGSDFPHLAVWTGDKAPALPPRDGSELTTLDEVVPDLWLSCPDDVSLFAQTLFQTQGYATTLLLAEWERGESNDDDQAPWAN